jgi:transcriptional activator of cad operon
MALQHVDPNACQVSRGKELLKVDARSMRLLMCLALRAGTTVTIEELLKEVWAGVVVTPDSVYQSITSLRRLLGDDPKRSQYIATVPRLGYRLIAAVTPWVDAPGNSAAAAPGSPPVGAERAHSSTLAAPVRRRWVIALTFASAAFLAITGADFVYHRITLPPRETVAVLPFLDLTTQYMNEEFFADGLTEELIGDLSKIPGLRIPSPTSSFYSKGKNMTVGAVAHQLGVAYVIDGSVRKSANIYRVAARLVRASDGYVVWSDTYDRSLGDLVKVQKDIAAEAAEAISASIQGNLKVEGSRSGPP